MERPPHVVEPPLSPGVTCVTCGYDLQGLMSAGDCPECGTPISFSVREDFYRFGDPERVGRLAWGATVVMVSLLVSVPLFFGLYTLDRAINMTVPGVVWAIGCASWILVHAAGWWMLSESEPGRGQAGGGVIEADGQAPRAVGERAREWLRDALVIFVAVTIGAIGLMVWRSTGGGTVAWFMTGKLVAALWLGSMAAAVGVLLTGLRHMMAMTRRLPPSGLGLRAEFLFLLVATISGIMAISAAVVGVFYAMGLHDAIEFLSGMCGCLSVPIWLLALVGVMVTAHSLGGALRREQALAIQLRLERGRGSLR